MTLVQGDVPASSYAVSLPMPRVRNRQSYPGTLRGVGHLSSLLGDADDGDRQSGAAPVAAGERGGTALAGRARTGPGAYT